MPTTPVLLIIFKRPEHTRRALAAIVAARPQKLFVAADGPRNAEEAAQCAKTRAVLSEIDIPVEVITNFSDTNLGCGIRVHSAISWAFTMTDELIILEDDCTPNASFFRFCDELLATYRDDERVMHISGDNFVGHATTGHSYYFSKYTHAWGWATWKRAWRHFDWRIERWPQAKAAHLIESWCPDPYEQRYWTKIFDHMYGGAPDVWDYMWMFACWTQSGLSVIPSVNLVLNDGWGPDATHTQAPIACPAPEEIGHIDHPPFVVPDVKNDATTFDRNFEGAAMRAADTPRARFRRRLSPFLGPARALKRLVRRLQR